MGENSKIEWTDHTFNPWVGCSKVHEGCQFCYAEINQFVRFKNIKWGDQGKRVITSDANWRKPIQWNAEAVKARRRARVFCASLADVFEDRPELVEPRRKLFALIDATPNLDWLLLTKRPEHILAKWPCSLDRGDGTKHLCARTDWHCRQRRANVWLGTSISLQEHADRQVPLLLDSHRLAAGLFLSIEPMLGPITLYPSDLDRGIGWVIVGGESGPKARPCHPEWVRFVKHICSAVGTPFFFKQWGEWAPAYGRELEAPRVELQHNGEFAQMMRVGKKKAGAVIDGGHWRETPFQAGESCPVV